MSRGNWPALCVGGKHNARREQPSTPIYDRQLDPFAGSGNTLYWLLRHLPGARGLGFDLDAGVYSLTQRNIALLELPIDIRNSDYRAGLGDVSLEPASLAALKERFDWTALRVYALNAPGHNHGILIGAKGWTS